MSFGTAYATKKRGQKCMAKGGKVENDGIANEDADLFENVSSAIKKGGMEGGEKPESIHDRVRRHMKEGEYMEDTVTQAAAEGEQDADMIARILHKRKEYSEGGMVANDVGVADADEAPAEFDDLVLEDDLEGEQPKDSNEHGDAISRIMSKRKKP